ncbi:phosphoenolpyruvate synthase [Syntrophotalea carbinolica DSM 2380]|uniref:Phosphoenolpyruvate synthase n=1 Tax=Syntrophotalea carbinolica (strain DSM 2380 / NBRC 103641 / GraBd1) TaxID=338963 RepID=Q3A1T3_SYNC1|nr:phosphoenolpyruvate synthase [Syntrophotalea carbinolica]ABA89674.1 phosphoenolpyruvate synthase [Syntrophotalea carbinolica DSM 2380]
MTTEYTHIMWFRDVGLNDLPLVGGKNASLGEMIGNLSNLGIKVPDGFAVTAEAYRFFLRETGLDKEIEELLKDLDADDIESLTSVGHKVRRAIRHAELPDGLEQAIRTAYAQMEQQYGTDCDVAVRSSATAEDLPDASFAGQQETYLNICGAEELLDACRNCIASLFTNRAISYREHHGFDHLSVALSVGVQKMVRSDLASAGVMFTISTETGFRDVVLINGAWGLGENVVRGAVNPDEFFVFKPTLKQDYRPILSKHIGSKQKKIIYSVNNGPQATREIAVPKEDQKRLCLEDDEVLSLARMACTIEDHYGRPMDIEWAKDGKTGELFIVQARPETVQSALQGNVLEEYHLQQRGEILARGRAVGSKIGAGRAMVIKGASEISRFQSGSVLVTDMTDPDWEPVMKKAAAIVTNRGGRTCHAAIVSRELGIPCVIGTGDATSVVTDGSPVTVCCAEGETGFVYHDELPFEIKKTNLETLQRPRTKIMMNLGNPEQALGLRRIPNDGVGLARLEFIINTAIKAHPMALLHPERVTREDERDKIAELIAGYPDGSEFFVDQLSQGVATLAGAFYPNDVIVRMSDFKSNEYANLLGGRDFEPEESNPMIGFRGASRYYDERYREGFMLECRAMKRVREDMGLKNVKLMIPFCRTVEEGRRVVDVMAHAGLERGKDGLELYVMCEIPSNVVLAEEFAEVFDGFSIGSNDLTQLLLGLDRDSEIVAHLYDERNEAVKRMIADVIRRVKAAGCKIGICGQAPSDYPEFAEFLVECGIDSISLNPDTVLTTTLSILELEEKLGRS